MERHQRLQRQTVDSSLERLPHRSLQASSFQTQGFGGQKKVATSTPASKAELWADYQAAKKLSENGIRGLPIQAKLTIGQPDDKYEQEADSVAEQVMAMSEPAQVKREELPDEEELKMKPLAETISPLMQRQELPEEEEELQMKSLDNSIQREELPEEEEELQMKQSPASNFSVATLDLESQLSSSKGGGSPLSDDVRSFMEPRFGADFSGVRVHTGSDAVQMNRDVNAQAFAHGRDIYFGAGKSPGNNELMAHELTHVVQQTGKWQAKAITTQVMRDSLDGGIDDGGSLPGGLSDELNNEAPTDPVAKLKLHADTETVNRSNLGLGELQGGQVGHSWVSLEYKDKTKIPNSVGEPTKALLTSGSTAFGFWPLINRASSFTTQQQNRIDLGQTPGTGASTNTAQTGYSLNPFTDVPGRVEEPDTAHTPKGTKEYALTQFQVNSLLTYVNSKRNANYNLYRFNCTDFAVESVSSAGQVAPGGSSLGVCLPNALYSDLYQMMKEGDRSVTVAPLVPGERNE